MNNKTVPEPDHISFPWDESNSKFTSASNINYSRDCISTSEIMSEMTVVPHETRQEEKLRNTSVVQIGNSSNGNTQGEKVYQCEKARKSRPCDPDCAGDSGGSRRVEEPYSSSEYQRYHETPGSKSAILHDYISTGKPSSLFEPSNRDLFFDDQIPETVAESPVTARIPSPSSASSITSGRRLEWDSGADVGYHFIQDSNNHSSASLSTIERIALARGCSAALFERLDPEGVSGPPKPVLSARISCGELESPIGKSTPIYKIENKTSSRNAGKDLEIPVVESPDTVLQGDYLYLHSGAECENEVAPSPGNGSGEENDERSDVKISTSDCFNKKHSNSLTNLSSSHEEIQNSVPRSQSYLNLLDKDDDLRAVERDLCVVQQPCILAATCSVSSSSVATIVQKPMFPKTSDKFIQTLPLKLSVGVQTSEGTDHSCSSPKVTDMPHDAYSSVTVVCDETKCPRGITACNSNGFQRHKCNGAHKKGSVGHNYCQNYQRHGLNPVVNNKHSEKSTEKIRKENLQTEEFHTIEKCPGTLDSVVSSSQTAESSCAVDTSCSAVEMHKEGHRSSTGVVDSANSFEYLPGHIFEKAFKHQSGASKQSAMPETSENKVCSKSNVSTQNNGRSDSRSSSLSKDIEDGVELLQKLMSEKSYNGKMKKKLIRQIINKLVNTNYPEDYINNEQFDRIPLSSNVPWVPATPDAPHLKTVNAYHFLSVGERNNESRKSVQNSSVPSSDRGKSRSIESATSEIHSSPSCTPSGSLSVPGDNEQSQAETSVSSNIVSETSRKNWKLPTSRTEKHFETNRMRLVKNGSPTPSLLHLCKSEHEKQLQWIRFEIDHLSHLKQLLEKQEVVTKPLANLADHEHRFHKFKPVDKKHVQNSKFQRSKTKGCDNWSNSTEYSSERINESSQSNASLKTQSSSDLCYQEPLLSDSSHSQIPKSQISHLQNQERTMRTTENKHNLSTQTLTLDSYVLHNVGSTNSEVKRLSSQSHSSCSNNNNNNGCLNVYVQTSPNSLKKRVHQNIQNTKVEESARKRSAVKCCCHCRRALEGIVHTDYAKKKDENIQTFCRCKSTNSESDHPATDVSCSLFGQSLNTTQSHTPESNSTDGIHLPEKRDIATETVENKSTQTSRSLNNVPIIKPVWIREYSRNESQKEGNFCPCCGYLEKPLETEQRQNSRDKPKKRADVKTIDADGGRGKNNEICDASVQTTNKEPLAYLLTFEPTSEANVRTQSNDSLPEIKLLVPVSQNRLENGMKKKTSNMNTYKENQFPPNKSSQRESNSLNQLLQEGEKNRTHKLTLQEYLQTNRSDYIQHADKRSQCLADLAILRDLRKQKRLELMAMTDQPENGKSKIFPSNEKIVFTCAAVPSIPKFTSRVMREQSRRKYHKTRELQNKLVEKKKKEDFRTNRLMAELFTKKLQKKVLQGVVNHSNSASVISSVP